MECITGDATIRHKAQTPGSIYDIGECKGHKNRQAEAIAQARYLSTANKEEDALDAGIHFEVGIPDHRKSIDALFYDPSDANAPIELVELKVGIIAGARNRAAEKQVKRYVNGLKAIVSDEGYRVVLKARDPSYRDTFKLRQICAASDVSVKQWEYVVTNPNDGVVMVTLASEDIVRCQDGVTTSSEVPPEGDPADEEGEEEQEEEERRKLLRPVKIRNIAREYPEFRRQWRIFLDDNSEEVREAKREIRRVVKRGVKNSTAATRQSISRLAMKAATDPVLRRALGRLGLSIYGPVALVYNTAVVMMFVSELLQEEILPPETHGYGDPHMVTLDGLAYDLHSIGEFTLVETEDFTAQIRTLGDNSGKVAWIGSAAFALGEQTLEIRRNGDVIINGEETDVASGDTLLLGTDAAMTRAGKKYEVAFIATDDPSEFYRITVDVTNARGLVVGATPPEGHPSWGLLGNNDANPRNDLALANGTQLPAATSPSVIHNQFANSWRIDDDDSFFSYAEGESTNTFTNLNYPSSLPSIADYSDAEIDDARAVCHTFEVKIGPQLDACTLDVLLADVESWAGEASATRGDMISAGAAQFDTLETVIEEDFSSPIPVNFTPDRAMTDGVLGDIAGPIGSSGYSFSVPEIPRHDTLNMSLDLLTFGNTDDSKTQAAQVKVADGVELLVEVEGDQPSVSAVSPAGTVPTGTILDLMETGRTDDSVAYSRYRLQIPLSHHTSSLGARVIPINFGGSQFLGIDSIELSISAPTPESFDITFPYDSEDDDRNGVARLERGASTDVYNFTIQSGVSSRVTARLPMAETRALPSLRMVGADAPIAEVRRTSNEVTYANLSPGDYQFAVDSTGARPAVNTYRITIALSPGIVDTGEVILDGPIHTMTTTAVGQRAQAEINIDSGSRVALRLGTQEPEDQILEWDLKNSQGRTLTSGSADGFVDPVELEPGRYTLTYAPKIRPGSMTVEAWAAEDVSIGVLTVGGAKVSYAPSTRGARGIATFNGSVGQRLTLNSLDQDDGGIVQVTLTGPSGRAIWSTQGEGQTDALVLPEAGTYRVTLDPIGDALAGISVALSVAQRGTYMGRVQVNGPDVRYTAPAPAAPGYYKFHAKAGTRIAVLMHSNTHYATRADLLRPDGTQLWYQLTDNWSDALTITQTGEHRLTINTNSTSSLGITFSIFEVPPDVQVGEIEAGGPTVRYANTVPGQNGEAWFEGTANQKVAIKFSDRTWYRTDVSIYSPTGARVYFALAPEFAEFELPNTGRYRIVVDSQKTNVGGISMQLRDVPPDVNLGDLVIDGPAIRYDNTTWGQNGVAWISGTAGQRISLRFTNRTHYRTDTALYSPSGARLWSHIAPDYVELTLPADGRYKLVIDNPVANIGGLNIEARSIPA